MAKASVGSSPTPRTMPFAVRLGVGVVFGCLSVFCRLCVQRLSSACVWLCSAAVFVRRLYMVVLGGVFVAGASEFKGFRWVHALLFASSRRG